MGEWFREFQVACAKSEDVMQKKSSAKSLRELSSAHYAFSAPSGNILDDDNFDTIRFCDPLPLMNSAHPHGEGRDQANEGGPAGAAAAGLRRPPQMAPALPADMLENVSLATLMGQSMVSNFYFIENNQLLINCADCEPGHNRTIFLFGVLLIVLLFVLLYRL